MQSALHDLKVTIWAFDQAMDPYFSDETDREDARTWEYRLMRMSRVLLQLSNGVIDLYGPASSYEDARTRFLWEIHTESLEKYGIIPTEDGKLFTFKKDASEAVKDAD